MAYRKGGARKRSSQGRARNRRKPASRAGTRRNYRARGGTTTVRVVLETPAVTPAESLGFPMMKPVTPRKSRF